MNRDFLEVQNFDLDASIRFPCAGCDKDDVPVVLFRGNEEFIIVCDNCLVMALRMLRAEKEHGE